jgi:hypothetical protein
MKQPGLGVMVKALSIGDDETRSAIQGSLDKTITSVYIEDDNLYINFTDNTALRVWDGGQSCCEHRYMTCDDILEEYSGAKLINVKAKPATYSVDEEWGNSYETMFLEFETTNGVFTIVNHNSHNGWYGGFWVEAEVTDSWIPKL